MLWYQSAPDEEAEAGTPRIVPLAAEGFRRASTTPARRFNYNVFTAVAVPELRFDWDQQKNTQNQRKHGVSFEEAQTMSLYEQAF